MHQMGWLSSQQTRTLISISVEFLRFHNIIHGYFERIMTVSYLWALIFLLKLGEKILFFSNAIMHSLN